MANVNREGLTWREWCAAAFGNVPCCTNAFNQCGYGHCPRLEAWLNGSDPSDYRAALE